VQINACVAKVVLGWQPPGQSLSIINSTQRFTKQQRVSTGMQLPYAQCTILHWPWVQNANSIAKVVLDSLGNRIRSDQSQTSVSHASAQAGCFPTTLGKLSWVQNTTLAYEPIFFRLVAVDSITCVIANLLRILDIFRRLLGPFCSRFFGKHIYESIRSYNARQQ